MERSVDLIGPHGKTVQFWFDVDGRLVAIVDEGVAFTANARLTEWLDRFQAIINKAHAELTPIEYAEFLRNGMTLLKGLGA